MRNGGGETFSAQNIALKKSMELNIFIAYLWLKVIKLVNYINFF